MAAGPKGTRVGPALHFPILAEGLDLALHYGWFETPGAVRTSLDDLRQGQVAFTREVVSLVPDSARRVLDVGTGRGETARALALRGAEVVTLSPDPNQGAWLARAPHPAVHFQALRFEDYWTSGEPSFDAVVLSESSNYVALDNLLVHSAALTLPGASLVVAAPFLRGTASATYSDMHRLDAFRDRLGRSAWRLRQELDFTENVAPTLSIGRALIEQRVVPSVRAVERYLAERGPVPLRVLSWLMRPYRRRGYALLERELPALLDEATFRRDVAFLFLHLSKDRS
jgi:SAM-dependent methyltransferase